MIKILLVGSLLLIFAWAGVSKIILEDLNRYYETYKKVDTLYYRRLQDLQSRITITPSFLKEAISLISAIEKEEKENNWEWIIHNKIKYNTNTKKSYFVIAPIKKGSNTDRIYILSDRNNVRVVAEDEIKDYVNDSYWSDKEKPAVQNITLENVLTIWN